MNIFTLRTDTADATLSIYKDSSLMHELKWEAGRELSSTLHHKLHELLQKSSMSLSDIHAIAVYQGPGSFTGLRIGIASMNALAYALDIPIVGGGGQNWPIDAQGKLAKGKNDRIIQPYYGAVVKTTKPRK